MRGIKCFLGVEGGVKTGWERGKNLGGREKKQFCVRAKKLGWGRVKKGVG